MTFSAAACITYNPTTQTSEGPFDIYLNGDYTSTPIITGVDINLLIGTNCPYIIEVPEGTTSLGFKDTVKDYCLTILIKDNDICSNCNLGLSQYPATTVTRVSCGVLTGTCQNITSYYINWYGPDDTTTLQFTSGFGPDYNNEWNILHPFIGINAVPAIEGDYTPIIQKITINGIKYSNTGGNGYILFDGNCLQPTTVEPLTCSNRTNTATTLPYSAYSHNVRFENTEGIIPQPVNLTYVISDTTKFMAIAFCGFEFNDRLTVKFKGIHYGTTEIGLEDILVGTDTTTEFSATTFPKRIQPSQPRYFYTKIICLTGLTVNNNDKLSITVTPYNNDTGWDLYMTCLEDYTCIDCLRTQPYKIIGSSITGVTTTCNFINISYNISGCTRDSWFNSDYLIYYFNRQRNILAINNYLSIGQSNNPSGIFNGGPTTFAPSEMYFSSFECLGTFQRITADPLCRMDNNTPGGSETFYEKTFLTDGTGRGVFNITGSSRVISSYYNAWINAKNSVYSGNTNPSTLQYYDTYLFTIPRLDSGTTCDDGELGLTLYIHQSSNVITGNTGTYYYFRVTANTITNDTSFTNCNLNCIDYINDRVSLVNLRSTGMTSGEGSYPLNSPSGKYFINPIPGARILRGSVKTVTGKTFNSNFVTFDWISNTIPFSGSTPTLIPSLSGTVCNYNNTGQKLDIFNSSYNINTKIYHQVRLTNPSNVNDFDIWASPIDNLLYSGAPLTPQFELAYRYSGGNVTFSSSTYII